MKKLALPLATAIVLLSCGTQPTAEKMASSNEATSSQTDTAKAVTMPAALQEKMKKILDDYQKKISNDFWSAFTSTTRRGREGTTENTFDATAYADFMQKKGFSPIPNTMLDVKGNINGTEILITEKTVSGERGGWIQQWLIQATATTAEGTFTDKREFTTQAPDM